MRWRKTERTDRPPWKLLLWTAVAGFIFAIAGLGEIAEDMLRASRNTLHRHSASGDIVLVTIDNRALREIGRWPWPRRHHAELIDQLTEAGAKRIFLDVLFETQSDPLNDTTLADAIKRSGRVVMAARAQQSGPRGLHQPSADPMQMFSRHAQLASIAVDYNYQNAVWRLPYAVSAGGKPIPSFAASLASRQAGTGHFTPDYSIKPTSIPHLPVDKVLTGRFDRRAVEGKDVVIGTNTKAIGDQFFIPGVGKMGGVYLHIIGAETLKQGLPVHLGWIPALLVALALASWAALRRRRSYSWPLAGTTAALLVVPVFLEANLIFVEIMPALFTVLTVWAVLGRRSIRKRGLVNSVSGLPNLSALRTNKAGRDRAVIAARVLNYEEALATLPPDSERQLVDQIISRLRVGQPERVLYQGDAGIFAWFEEPRLPVGNHIEAVHGLFRNPARVNGLSIDLSVSFGVEIGSSRSLANRLASALVAAEEAAHHGLKWKYYDTESLADASWKLSILSQLDSAVDKGEVWVAYQPKLDLASRKIIGAEALARWTHPEKGPISAAEFIAAAEQHDRIGKLTDFALEQAIRAAAAVNRKQSGFGIAVNLSARLLTDMGFILRLRAMLARHGLAPELLTLELTETAALAGSGPAFDMLAALRELGVTISIDDYGTGLSTLDYLKKIPASEIKIDQSFVKSMLDNRSDRVMVQSTIALAHSLGRRVVAEGVEQQAVLDVLVEMKCDVAQGFVIGRPMSIDSLLKRLSSARGARVA